ncbi:MAG: hypothetical protein KDE32_03800 [Novosphingobium sp.]|nr:hypothetical protein [Novosphingobium sp.]
MTRKRRSLVLTNEAARHPFRASLPMSVFVPLETKPGRRLTLQDARDFIAAYTASFVAVAIFIG